MSPSKKSAGSPGLRRSHAARRHNPAAPVSKTRPSRLLLHYLIVLETAGWRVVELRPTGTEETTLWRVTIERVDKGATMTTVDAEVDSALAELVRYAQVDAR